MKIKYITCIYEMGIVPILHWIITHLAFRKIISMDLTPGKHNIHVSTKTTSFKILMMYSVE